MLKPFLPAEHVGDVAHVWEDDGQGGGLIHSTQDIGPSLEQNKAMRLHNDGYSKDRTLRRVAHIPFVVRQHIMETQGWDPYRPDLYPEKLAQLLNDPDWALLRTADGVVASVNGQVR